ncbi:MAG: kynureninase [Gammaproteobacteria bacterium]|nr:kynureninase [Gammaproteobacteria bacterium]
MDLEQLRELDANDSLASKRVEFKIPEGLIYLDGNSLGPLPAGIEQRLQEMITQQWGQDLISSWNKHQWIDLPVKVGERIAPLLGAAPGQVVCCDSISVNLFKLLGAALQLNSPRRVVLSQQDNFPTDLYTAQGIAGLLGDARCQLKQVSSDALYDALDETVAVLMLTHVNFRSGAMHDMRELTRRAHDVGALVIWDLAHSAGAVPLALDADNVDFAVGCGYKYLNGGPGAPAFVYVAERLQQRVEQPLSGWMGHSAPFNFDAGYAAAAGAKRFLSGTPPILSMAVLDAALDVFDGVDMQDVRAKSQQLCQMFLGLMRQLELLPKMPCASPANDKERGSQLAFQHGDAFAIAQALIDQQVIVDFRAPDILRFGFCPLYTRFEDIWHAVHRLSEIVTSGTYKQEIFNQRGAVT